MFFYSLFKQQKETVKLLSTILEIQPKSGGSSQGKMPDDIVYDLAGSILKIIPNPIDKEKARQDLSDLDDRGRINSLTTVLIQEVDRYNRLLGIIEVGVLCAMRVFNCQYGPIRALYFLRIEFVGAAPKSREGLRRNV